MGKKKSEKVGNFSVVKVLEPYNNKWHCSIFQDPIETLPPDLRFRARELFIHVVQYALEILTWPHTDGLPVGLQPPHMDNTYATILFNDEVHTYEQVSILC